jgi:methyl-accepting chemotaxis protein
MTSGNLTIGRRIALGFTLVLVLLGIVSAVAWLTLGASGRKLALYAGSTQETNTAATLETSMLELKLHVNEFLATPTTEHTKAYQDSKQKLDQDLAKAAQLIEDPERKQQLDEAGKLLGQYDSAFQRVVENSGKLDAVVAGKLTPLGDSIAKGLQKVLTDAKNNGDMNGAFKVSNALKAYFECSSLVNSFLLTSREDFAEGRGKGQAAQVAPCVGRRLHSVAPIHHRPKAREERSDRHPDQPHSSFVHRGPRARAAVGHRIPE